MLHELNMVARDRELIVEKRQLEAEITDVVDPDKFPINRLSADLVKERASLWEIEPELLDEVEHFHGHSLRMRESEIGHHMAGRGVFLSARR